MYPRRGRAAREPLAEWRGHPVNRWVLKAARPSTWRGAAGDEVAKVGDEVVKAGNEVVKAGNEVARAGNEVARAGDVASRATASSGRGPSRAEGAHGDEWATKAARLGAWQGVADDEVTIVGDAASGATASSEGALEEQRAFGR
ncbi:hypothetical protein FOMPIDRAFT_87094 [Fomitopsis schrenkii]|uniref:Uncharacterized protein n=1 Tax=Fomitopsis schrenkii TaxID=2126942 RepID=S8DJ74_FOMSC|nr:hypothetical protein FOMPIDRAFT_87094 [Fomitopsis schrenkii]